MALCTLFPPMKLYKAPENTEALKTWDLVEKLEPTPDSPWVRFFQLIFMVIANKNLLQPTGYGIGQNTFEGILRKKIAEYGVQVELGMELIGLDQHNDGVIAHVRSHKGEVSTVLDIEASCVIGADGAKGNQSFSFRFSLILS